MDTEQIDNIYRSRITVLDILEERGYDTSPYRKFSPVEAAIASSALSSLNVALNHREDASRICHLIYIGNTTAAAMSDNLTSFIPEEDSEQPNVEVVVMTFIENLEKYHNLAAKMYITNKLRVFFFNIPRIVNNPTRHILVPKHELLPRDEHKGLLERLYVTEKRQLPHISSADPIIRCIGGVPGDIVRIMRPSPSAGLYEVYRLIVP
jgi:DNA-directed RNA polymerase subunit H